MDETLNPGSTDAGDSSLSPADSVTAADADSIVASDTPITADTAQTVSASDETASDTAGSAGDDSVAGSGDGVEEAEIVAPSTGGDETVTLMTEDAASVTPPPPRAPAPQPAPQRGGLVPLVLGGVVAAGIGYGAAYMGLLPTTGPASDTSQTTAIAEALATQAETLAALQAQVAELAATPASGAAASEIDLTPVTDQIGALAGQIESATATLGSLADRVAVLEDRPVFSGDITADSAAALEAATALEAELEAQRAAAEEQAATLQAAAEAAATAAAEAEAQAAAAVAEAEAQAAAALARAEADAALVQLQVALETGAPFADALAALGEVTEVPPGLGDLAASGVPTLGALQADFPALARAALPRALQEAAGDSMGDRLGAFVMGQIGGRSVAPREGDDPDAVLSRIGAAIEAGELDTVLTELAALPEGAQAELAPWAAGVQARATAVDGLAILSDALASSGN
ncbi:COG4223 family protein [Roseicyclus marinus]|uniref:COG4223 family protein n=1 Tax=Roseicyclus marinus TaxID=2161673 RepID=UPI00240EC6CA|nr:hypothetical protein [Roseicyclus marinus]MDG3041246.1 hypothetical protein [Roseicyclus marinus]